MKLSLTFALFTSATLFLTGCGGNGSPAATTSTNVASSQPMVLGSSRNDNKTTSEKIDITAAYQELNKQRTACGFAPLNISSQLEQAAYNHSRYLLQNPDAGHSENSLQALYTGSTAAQRSVSTGYLTTVDTGSVAEELVILKNQAQLPENMAARSVRTLLSAPYHMLGMLDDVNDMGATLISDNSSGMQNTIFNLYVGRKINRDINYNANAPVLTYPCANSTDVPVKINSEYPDPLLNLKGADVGQSITQTNPIGQPIMVRSPNGTQIEIHKVTIKDAQQNAIDTYIPLTQASDKAGQVLANEAVIMPRTALKPQTAYRVQIIVSYVHQLTGIRQDKLIDYTFMTGSETESLF